MPEEMFYDPDILDLRESIKQLHQDFIQTHKEHDAAQNAIKYVPIEILKPLELVSGSYEAPIAYSILSYHSYLNKHLLLC